MFSTNLKKRLKKNYDVFHVPKRQIERDGKWITSCHGDEKQVLWGWKCSKTGLWYYLLILTISVFKNPAFNMGESPIM